MRALLPGDRAGRYVIEAVIGEGGMGRVYRAHDDVLRRTVALKVLLRAAEGADAAAVARVLREARAAAAIEHTNAVAIYDAGEIDGTPYVAMEFVAGRPLRAYIGSAAVDVPTKLRWLVETARALGAAHRAGIVHRDVKPENVMVRDDGTIKVLDFGIARRADPEPGSTQPLGSPSSSPTVTGDGLVVGTPIYMSPEQVAGAAVDGRADQFAWGVVAFELLTGVVPWKAPGGRPLLAEIVTTDAPAPSSLTRVPALADAVIHRALARSREGRFASMAALLEALEPTAALTPTLDATADTERVPPRASWPFTPWMIAPLAVAMIAAAWLGVRGAARSHRATAASAAPSSSAPPASMLVRVTDLPLPTSSSADALAQYRLALQQVRDGFGAHTIAVFDRVVKADPELSAVVAVRRLSAGLGSSAALEAQYRIALARRTTLSEHDQAIVQISESLYGSTEGSASAFARADDAVHRSPADEELSYMRARIHVLFNDLAGAEPLLRDVVGKDPTLAPGYYELAEVLASRGDTVGARAELQTCVDAVPDAASCLALLAAFDEDDGRCEEAETLRRRRVAIDAETSYAHFALAYALEGRGAPDEVVLAALASAASLEGHTAEDLAWPLYLGRGQFVRGRAALSAIESTPRASITFGWNKELFMATRALVLEETGDFRAAGAFVLDYLRIREASGDSPDVAWVAIALGVAHRAGALTAAEAIATPLAPPGVRVASQIDEDAARALVACIVAQDAPAAKGALDALRAALPAGASEWYAGPFAYWRGRTALLAGDVDGAIVELSHVAGACTISKGPFGAVRAALQWGQALEKKGDAKGACAAYGRVLSRWGHAQPRSITADSARARMSALRCAP